MGGQTTALTDVSLRMGSREEVLVVSQPVAVGQLLTSTDLRAARGSTGSGLDVCPVDAGGDGARTASRCRVGGRLRFDADSPSSSPVNITETPPKEAKGGVFKL